jgi:cysteinyl-tRNA synthetase
MALFRILVSGTAANATCEYLIEAEDEAEARKKYTNSDFVRSELVDGDFQAEDEAVEYLEFEKVD